MILGVGGGGLIHALKYFHAGIKLTAVELRQAVIQIAQQYFYFMPSKKCTIIHQDALYYLAETQDKKVDIIFADIYHADGVDESQVCPEFIENSATRLKQDGYLVLNCWKEYSQDQALLALLQQHFSHVAACLTNSGNWVVFASKTRSFPVMAQLKQQAKKLANTTKLDLQPQLSRFQAWD